MPQPIFVGQQSFGDTMPVKNKVDLAGNHWNLKCGVVRYEVARTDTFDSRMVLMPNHRDPDATIVVDKRAGEDGPFS